jgi:hypothetical protein
VPPHSIGPTTLIVAGVKGGVVAVWDLGSRALATSTSGPYAAALPPHSVARHPVATLGHRPLGEEGELHSVDTDLTTLTCPRAVALGGDGAVDLPVAIGEAVGGGGNRCTRKTTTSCRRCQVAIEKPNSKCI